MWDSKFDIQTSQIYLWGTKDIKNGKISKVILNSLLFQQYKGKKPKKGLFNGNAKILIASESDNKNYNYGFKNNKCIKVYSRMVSYISGNFISDVLEVIFSFVLLAFA